jgi:branched-chain amino acid transport system ATP-binding protein
MTLLLEDVHAYYGPSHVLHGVSLMVQPGEVVALLGRNGAGKTTTLLTAMGFLRPAPGRVLFEDRDIGGRPPFQVSRLGIGFVPQERGVFPSLTVKENLVVASRKGATGEWTLERIYELFPRLRERAAFRGSQLSGGEQQMLSIARALLLNPTLLILDEPSEGLAPLIVKEILSILQGVRERGVAILLVEQNVRAALAIADRCYVLSKGAVCFAGTPVALQANEEVMRAHLGV